MEQIQKAAFYIRDYYFERVTLDINNKPNGDELSVSFQTSGEFNKQNNSFNLRFRVDIGENFVSIICVGQFIFENANDITEIPDFFYVNSVALLFPYVRAYISLITT